MEDLQALVGIFLLELPPPKCSFNLRHREERMLQFGFHHNILYGHIMRLLGPLHTSFENAGNHQAIYGLIVAVIDLNRRILPSTRRATPTILTSRNVCAVGDSLSEIRR